MMVKTVIVLIAILFTAHVSSRVVLNTTDDDQDGINYIKHFINVVLTVFKILTTAIDLALGMIKRALESALSNTDLLKKIVINLVEAVIDKIKEDIANDIAKLQNTTSADGVDIFSCVTDAEDTLAANANNVIQNGASCVIDLVHEFGTAFESVIQDLESTNQDIEKANDNISSCTDDWINQIFPCVFAEFERIWGIISSFGSTYKNDFDLFRNAVGQLTRFEDICVETYLEEFKKDNEQILSDFTTCIEEKLNGLK